jgi:transcriptional regulator with XRE-family HTH domain
LSQLELADAAGASQRHVSFLESGRTTPSRAMVLRLAAALGVPLREQNSLLLAAGYAPAWRESELSAPELAKVDSAINFMLTQQEPYPGVVVDRRWNLLRANKSATRMVEFLLGPAPSAAAASEPPNLAHALMSPDALRPYLQNWEEVALYFLRGVEADALADGTRETSDLLRRLRSYPDAPMLAQLPDLGETRAPVLVMQFRKEDTAFNLFTTLATLGVAHDITLQEVRIECFFPADDSTARLFQRWAVSAAAPVEAARGP